MSSRLWSASFYQLQLKKLIILMSVTVLLFIGGCCPLILLRLRMLFLGIGHKLRIMISWWIRDFWMIWWRAWAILLHFMKKDLTNSSRNHWLSWKESKSKNKIHKYRLNSQNQLHPHHPNKLSLRNKKVKRALPNQTNQQSQDQPSFNSLK